MARGGSDGHPKRNPKTPPNKSLLRAKNGLDKGVHFSVSVSGLASVEMKTALVTNSGASSNSKARMVVITATGMEESGVVAVSETNS
jgi:hypothetical protein